MAPVMGVKGASGLAMAAGMLVLVVLAKRGLERRGVAEEPAELLEGPPRNIPSAFAEEAERTRIETAIRRAASKLQEERGEKGRLERVYAEEAAKAEAEGMKADKLLGKGKAAASQAVVKRAEYEVENSKADTDEKSVDLNKKIASLLAYRSQSLKVHAQHRAADAKELAERAEELMKHREELSEDAKKEGEQADAIVSTANNLLQSAKEMSGQAQSERTASSQPDKLARLKIARKEAKNAMNEDIEKLARSKLHHKELTGIEGVDELSRAQEQISAVEKELNDNDKMP